jgi:hypothetical protein
MSFVSYPIRHFIKEEILYRSFDQKGNPIFRIFGAALLKADLSYSFGHVGAEGA